MVENERASGARTTLQETSHEAASLTRNNTQSVTGRNLRGILLETSKARVEDITEDDIQMIGYHPLDESEQWRIAITQEGMEIRSGKAILLEGWTCTT